MQTPNENGVYAAEVTEELARKGRSFASVDLAQCDDGLWRFALHYQTSYSGGGGPITRRDEGYATLQAAKDAGTAATLARWPTGWPSDPDSVKAELAELRRQIEARQRQPMLF